MTEPTDDPDDGLLRRWRSGDKQAFDEIVRKYERAIVGLARRYTAVQQDAEDIAQMTFLRAFERLESYRAEAKFRSWLYRIAINLAIDRRRGEKDAHFVPVEDDMAFTNSLGTEKLVAAEVWRKVKVRLAELPPRQRLVVELRVFHDLAFDEIAAIVDSSEDAAKMNYHHGVKRLQAILRPPPA